MLKFLKKKSSDMSVGELILASVIYTLLAAIIISIVTFIWTSFVNNGGTFAKTYSAIRDFLFTSFRLNILSIIIIIIILITTVKIIINIEVKKNISIRDADKTDKVKMVSYSGEIKIIDEFISYLNWISNELITISNELDRNMIFEELQKTEVQNEYLKCKNYYIKNIHKIEKMFIDFCNKTGYGNYNSLKEIFENPDFGNLFSRFEQTYYDEDGCQFYDESATNRSIKVEFDKIETSLKRFKICLRDLEQNS